MFCRAGVLWDGSDGIQLDTGARSKHYGNIQRQHQEWLTRKVKAQKEGGAQQYTPGGEPSHSFSTNTTSKTPEIQERIHRASIGIDLWDETYVPPIEPVRRQGLIDKWTGKTWSPPENSQVRVFKPGCAVILETSDGSIFFPLGIQAVYQLCSSCVG